MYSKRIRPPRRVSKKADYEAVLVAIYQGMLAANEKMREATDQHAYAFLSQMQQVFGVSVFPKDEPYLEYEQRRIELQLLQTLQRILERVERKYFSNLAKDWDIIDEMVFKAIDPNKPLGPQIEKRATDETIRAKRRLKQRLDSARQQEVGTGRYIWRTAHDERVRSSHRANDGKIFWWNKPPPTGHPGEDYNCRCKAQPATWFDIDPPINSVYPELILLPVGKTIRTIGSIIKTTKDKLDDYRQRIGKPTEEPAPQKPVEKPNRKINVSDKQAQSKYKHAEDFGLPKNYSKQNGEKLKDAVQNHVLDKNTKVIEGSYRGKKVTHYYNKDTGINVIKDGDGNFLSGWKLSPEQQRIIVETGKIGGSKCLDLS